MNIQRFNQRTHGSTRGALLAVLWIVAASAVACEMESQVTVEVDSGSPDAGEDAVDLGDASEVDAAEDVHLDLPEDAIDDIPTDDDPEPDLPADLPQDPVDLDGTGDLDAFSDPDGIDATDPIDDQEVGDAVDAVDLHDPIDDPVSVARTRYPPDRTQSPLTPSVVESMEDIMSRGVDRAEDVFMKVGDSITVSNQYLFCFAGTAVDLSDHDELEPTLDLFLGGEVGDTTPFDRVSLSAEGGRTASWVVTGSPSPLRSELDAISPHLAVIMFGTNDIGWYPGDFAYDLRWYSEPMFELVESLMAEGIVPLLMSIPPRDDDAELDRLVSSYNMVVRGMAQGFQVPFIDFHRALLPLPSHGLSADGVHPNAYREAGTYRACVFTPEALAYGYNVRNLLTLEALHRVVKTVYDGEDPPDRPLPEVAGSGTPDDPWVIDTLPFSHMADTEDSPTSLIDAYTGCSAAQDESGPEYYYRLEVDHTTSLRAFVVSSEEVDVDVHLLSSGATAADCLARAHTLITRDYAPGTYVFSLDTFVSAGEPLAGRYVFVVLPTE